LRPVLTKSHRDGIDGSWSTFALQLGTPPQAVRLLPSITGDTIWAVLPQACGHSGSTCATDRGGIFTTNQSSTWEDKGFFQLPLNPEHYLPFSGAADFGFDNVTLNWQGYGGMTLGHQVVAGYITEDFYVGSLGLSPLSVNITSFNDQYPSLVGTLKAEGHIPSTSWGYTAGASYRSFPATAFGSLTLGGYDSTRIDLSKNLTSVGGSDMYRPFLLGIEKITTGSTQLLDAPIITAIDSLVSQLWLPILACRHFEAAFGLVWNESHELYIVNDTQHSALLAQNPSVTFTMSTGTEQNGNDRVDITLPYAAFDLTAKPPYAGLNETVHYFPLKQAANETQYTLGRTFLQEAYIVADYDRSAQSLFPAVFPDSSVKSNLVPIHPPGDTSGVSVTQTNQHSGLPRTAMIGIVVGAIVALSLVSFTIWFCLMRWQRRKARKVAVELPTRRDESELTSPQTYHGSELEGHVVHDIKHELASPVDVKEWKGSQLNSSISSHFQEMQGDNGGSELCPNQQIYEMP
jgi:Eukaryotic aspartyl protease